MNKNIVTSVFLRMLKKSVGFSMIIAPFLLNAQTNLQEAAKNLKHQEMEIVKGNYTSFASVHTNNTSWAKFNSNSYAKHPEFGKLPFNAEFPGYVEVLEKRQIDERYFVNEKNPTQFYIQKGLGDLHKKINGEWVTIDHRITDKGNGIYEASVQHEPVGFDVKKAVSYIKTVNGTVYFNNWKLYGETNSGEQLLATANWSDYTVGDDGLHINNIFPGIDAEMKVLRGAIKTNFIIKQLSYTGFVNLLFKDEFITGHGAAFKFKGDAAGSVHAVSEVELLSDNTSIVEIKDAVAFPMDGSKSKAISPEYKLEGSKLAIVIPVNYIQQNISTANIIIDPLVTSTNTLAQASITGSRYNASCNFTNSCNYNLTVNTPAMATFTDVLWSFTYQANGICFLQDGAVRFATGACLSPNTAGFYWFCNSANNGTCAGTNVSIFSDLSTCLPAPSCSAQPVTFTMQFFRSCWGPTGASCTNGACIGAASPWTMVIEGHTVEFTNPGSEFSLSANAICFGQSISATSNGIQYGVPAYSENWSFNSSGVPSVGSGSTPTINFPSAGTYTVYYIVTDACSHTATASQVVTVDPIPTITVNAVAPTICVGQSSVLTAGGASTYTWSANAASTINSTVTVTPPSSDTYTVTATSAAGCVNTNTVSVTVNPLPTVTAVASPTTICSGQSSTLTAGGASTYTWSANAVSATTNTVSVSPGATDIFTVTATDANSCSNTATISVNVISSPTLVTSATPTLTCAGHADTISVSGATSYTWSANAGSATTSTVSVNPVVTTTYTVVGDASGCTATETVVVNVTPLPSLTVTPAPASICNGQSSVLTANGATTYTWSANAGSVNTNTTSVSPSSTDTYTVSATQNGCSDSTTVTVSVGPPPTVSVTATQTTICSGSSTTLTGSGATNYNWSTGSSTNPLTVSPSTTTTYTLVGNSGGCKDSTTITINVNPTPTVVVNNPAPICSGSTSTLTASGATTFTWMPGSIVGSSVSVTPSNTTTYVVTGDSLGCTSTNTVVVNVTTTPTVMVIAATNTVCSGQSLPLIAGGATTYTWSANAGSATTQTVIVTPGSNPTIYTVTGANGNCQSTGTISIGVVTTPTLTAVSPPAICAGQSATLTASVAPGTANLNWQPGGSSNDTIIVSPSTSASYTVTANNGGCTDVKILSVTVNQLPTLSAITNQTVCYGNNVAAINFTTSAGAMVGWANTNTSIGIAASGTTNIAAYSAPNVTSQQVGVITAEAMDMTTGCTSATQSFTITINPSPIITGTPKIDSALCGMPIGDIKNLSASGGTAPLSYQWYNASGSPVSGGTKDSLINVAGGTYSLVVTDALSCKATAGPYVIGSSPAVVAAFTASTYHGTAPLPVVFTDGSTGAATYNWVFGNGSTSSSQNPSTNYSLGGTYVVILTASNGSCSDTAMRTIIVDQPILVTVPNVFSPNDDNINDEFSIITSGVTELTCEIFNRWGQKVFTIGTPTGKWNGKLDNGNTASEGTYFYMLNAKSYDNKSHTSQGSITLVK